MQSLVIMGVAGCGKTSLGQALAAALGLPFVEGDAHHAPASIAKMRAGIPLTDTDRQGWLDILGAELVRHPDGVVLSCSALKQAYRERLRAVSSGLGFVFLDITRELSLQRVAERAAEHLFPVSLVDSQFAALESPIGETRVLRLDAALGRNDQLAQALAWAQGGGA